jgi:hypothetical protein
MSVSDTLILTLCQSVSISMTLNYAYNLQVCDTHLYNLFRGHNIHKYGVLRLHLDEILVLHRLAHHGGDVLLDPLIHLPPTKMFVHSKKAW